MTRMILPGIALGAVAIFFVARKRRHSHEEHELPTETGSLTETQVLAE